ncbi:MAG: terpene cyclase/mutase family protein [Pirellulales bacterium]|nr:terpene cyclase/mutase family protein [Pirellulales bacterium]
MLDTPPRTPDRPPEPPTPAEPPRPRRSALRRRRVSGFVASMVFHAVLLVILALVVQATPLPGGFVGLTFEGTDEPVKLESSLPQEPALDKGDRHAWEDGRDVPATAEVELPPIGPISPTPAAAADHPLGVDPARLWQDMPTGTPGGLEGRTPAGRAQLGQERGSSPESENAVERALRWLAAQQHEDGSWTFYHPKESQRVGYQNPGTEPSTTAATALVLLPFLGAGYTHAGGEHQDVVGRGFYYLNRQAVLGPQGADLREGTMYAQGLAALALCEGYAMTHDPALRGIAQKAIDFIVFAQDKKGGGWRYTPGEPGDTTVTGWQLMALKSAQAARLDVPTPVFPLADQFLDGVAAEYGAQYGYMAPQPRHSTTAIGLLCRMYTGWRRDRPELERGVAYLADWGPSATDVYYNYYATQVLCHWEGTAWEKWNVAMRDHLVRSQSAEGLESGSWHFPDQHGDKGGRLYNTAMAAMILEVYYRHLPLYRPVVLAPGPDGAAEP